MNTKHLAVFQLSIISLSTMGCAAWFNSMDELNAPITISNPVTSANTVVYASEFDAWQNNDSSIACTKNSTDKTRYEITFEGDRICATTKTFQFIPKNKLETSIATFSSLKLSNDSSTSRTITQSLESAREVGTCTTSSMAVVSIVEMDARGCDANGGLVTDTTTQLTLELVDAEGRTRKLKSWSISNDPS